MGSKKKTQQLIILTGMVVAQFRVGIDSDITPVELDGGIALGLIQAVLDHPEWAQALMHDLVGMEELRKAGNVWVKFIPVEVVTEIPNATQA